MDNEKHIDALRTVLSWIDEHCPDQEVLDAKQILTDYLNQNDSI